MIRLPQGVVHFEVLFGGEHKFHPNCRNLQHLPSALQTRLLNFPLFHWHSLSKSWQNRNDSFLILTVELGNQSFPSCCGFPFKMAYFLSLQESWGPATGSAASAPSAALGFSGSSSSATSCTFKTDEPKGCRDCEEISERKQMGNQRQKHVKTIQIETIIIKSELW